MLSYIIRRILLMIPTLIGISIMVFLLARLAPGTPASTQAEAGQMSAEAQKALREWYEKRYGLDDPIWKQYLNWWAGMFTAEVEATAWTDEPTLRPIYTLRRTVSEYFAPLPGGGWAQVTGVDPGDATAILQSALEPVDPAALGVPESQTVLPTRDNDELYLEPRHAVVDGELHSIDEQLPWEVLTPVRSLSLPEEELGLYVFVSAGRAQGERVFRSVENPDRYYVNVDGQWARFEPRQAQSVWTLVLPTDTRGARFLEDAFGVEPEEIEGLATPPILTVEGDLTDPETTITEDDVVPFTVQRTVAVTTTLWVRLDSGEVVPLFEREEDAPILLVRNENDEWRRYVGASRIEIPAAALVDQSSETFQSRLPSGFADAYPDSTPDGSVRHALMDGREAPLFRTITQYDIRHHRHTVTTFEVTLGTSTTSHQTVMAELGQRLPVTLLISLTAFPILYMIALPTGIVMAITRGRVADNSSNVLLLALWSVPTVLSATLFIGYLGIGGKGLDLFPTNGLSSLQADTMPFFQWFGDRLWHLVLPVTCIVYGGCAYLAKQMRAAMLDNFTMDYVRTAKAKGVPAKDVVFRHVLRNSLLPIITIFATVLPVLIAGSIIIETIFNIEGMGLFTFRAVQNRDYDVVQAMAMVAGVLNLIGLLIADICYAVADPRISYK